MGSFCLALIQRRASAYSTSDYPLLGKKKKFIFSLFWTRKSNFLHSLLGERDAAHLARVKRKLERSLKANRERVSEANFRASHLLSTYFPSTPLFLPAYFSGAFEMSPKTTKQKL